MRIELWLDPLMIDTVSSIGRKQNISQEDLLNQAVDSFLLGEQPTDEEIAANRAKTVEARNKLMTEEPEKYKSLLDQAMQEAEGRGQARQQVSFSLPRAVARGLTVQAKRRGVTFQWIVGYAVRRHVDEYFNSTDRLTDSLFEDPEE